MTQEKALEIPKSGKNVFLTGSAGTGKTYILNQYINYLKEHRVPVAVTASTGIAATHMNGMTVHAWSGIGIKDQLTPKHLQTLRTKKYMREKMDEVAVLIIDEISMLHKNQLNLVDEVLRYFKQNSLPFGGIQVVFSGDFFQLPPVGESHETSKDKFCFMADAWVQAGLEICYLTRQYRQSENALNFLLNEIRLGEASQAAVSLLEEKIQESLYEDGEVFPQLYTHNADVDRINEQKIKEIDSPEKKFKAATKGNKVLCETLQKSVLAPEMLRLKTGAEVMFVRNNWEAGYFNGTLGVVKEFSESGFPVVETRDGTWIETKSETWSMEDEHGNSLASFSQIPLRLAWAITVHKSQGMTLDTATIDLRKTFEKGQGYVALSRLRDMNGLRLKGINPMVMQLDELARRADQRFMELSEITEETYDSEALQSGFKNFILHCGGTVNPAEINRAKEKNKLKKKAEKIPTHLITKNYWDDGLNLDEIAETRGLKSETILNHLFLIQKDFPDTDFSALKPDDIFIEMVKKALQKSDNTTEKTSLKFIHEVNNGEISYQNIRKALLFIPND